jgi:TonB family protein
MCLEREAVRRQSVGVLRGCLVEGDPQQRRHERKIRRRALAFSILVQSSALLALVLAPLFAKPAHLDRTTTTPVPQYRPYVRPARRMRATEGEARGVCFVCFASRPTSLTPDSRTETTQITDAPLGNEDATVACPGCVNIGQAPGPQPPRAPETRQPPRVLRQTRIDPAMLTDRVEPVYPTLAKQLGRSGRVELRAVISTDGTIQSLQIVSGDPLFYASALEAVGRWRYKPTMLNGELVEIDTFITVIYTAQH